MASLTELRIHREALVAAIATGSRRIEFGTADGYRRIEYHSPQALRDAIALIDAELAAALGRRPHTFLPTFNKGT